MWRVVLFSLLAVTEIPKEVAQYVQNRVAYGYEPAIAMALVTAEDDVFFVSGVQKTGGANATADTLFEIGSITKVFTALLLSDFVEREQAALDDPAQKYLPGHVTLPKRGGKEITLKHLATHTSGLPRLPSNMMPKDMANPYADYTFEQLYTYLNQAALTHDPGSHYAYSNLGAGLLGHVLERISGRAFQELVALRICDPLEMKDTVVAFREDQKNRIAMGHETTGVEVSHWDLPTLAGAGALRSTVKDMAKFLRANMVDSHSQLAKAIAATHDSQHTMAPGSEIGLGWHLLKRDGLHVIWHNGGTGGFRSFCGFDPIRKIGVVVLSSSTFGVDNLGLHLLDSKLPLPPIYQTVAVEFDLSTIIGKYIGKTENLSIKKDDLGLFAQIPGFPPARIYPMSQSMFFCKTSEMTLELERNEAGEVVGLVNKTPQAEKKYRKQKD